MVLILWIKLPLVSSAVNEWLKTWNTCNFRFLKDLYNLPKSQSWRTLSWKCMNIHHLWLDHFWGFIQDCAWRSDSRDMDGVWIPMQLVPVLVTLVVTLLTMQVTGYTIQSDGNGSFWDYSEEEQGNTKISCNIKMNMYELLQKTEAKGKFYHQSRIRHLAINFVTYNPCEACNSCMRGIYRYITPVHLH